MKKLTSLLSLILIAGFVFFTACEDEEDPTLTLESLTAGGVDLAGATQATDVPEDSTIIAVFSSELDEATVTKTSFSIALSDGGSVDYSLSIDGAKVMATPTNGWPGGSQFSIELTTGIEGANGAAYEGIELGFRTAGIFVPQRENQVLYLSFDNETMEDEAGDHTVSEVKTLMYETDRRGTQNSAAYFDGSGNLVEVAAAEDLISPSITISFWLKTALADYNGQSGSGIPQTRFVLGLGGEKGYFLEMGRRSNDPTADAYGEVFLKMATNHVNIGENSASVPEATAWTEVNSELSVGYESGTSSGWSYVIDQLMEDPPNRSYITNQIMGEWTHFVMTFDATAQEKTFYINGTKWGTFKWISSGADWLFSDLSLKEENNDGSPVQGLEGSLALGFAGSSTNTGTSWLIYDNYLNNPPEQQKFFKGSLDQFRIFSVPLNDAEVQQLYDNEK